MDFQSCSLSMFYRISNVVYVGVWIFSGIAKYESQFFKGLSETIYNHEPCMCQ